MKQLFYTLFFTMLIFSCSKTFDNIGNPDIKPNILGPIANTAIDLNDMNSFGNQTFKIPVSPEDLGIPVDSSIILIPISFTEKITLTSFRLNDFFKGAILDTALVSIEFTNIFPVAIQAGSIWSVIDSVSNDLIFSYELTEDLMPNIPISFQKEILDTKINSVLNFELTTLNIAGSDQNIVNFSSTPIEVSLSFELLSLSELELYSGFDYEIIGETELGFSDEEVEIDAVTGKINMFVTNNLAFETTIKIEVLDINNTVTYTFFNESNELNIDAAFTDGYGNVTNPYISEPIILLEKNEDQNGGFTELINGEKLRFRIQFSTPDNAGELYYKFKASENLALQLTADLIIDASK